MASSCSSSSIQHPPPPPPPSPAIQETKNFDNLNNCLINFGSLSIGEPNPDDSGVTVSGSALGLAVLEVPPPANFSEQFQGAPKILPSPLFFDSLATFPTSQPNLGADVAGWPATSLNPSQNIWASPYFYNNAGYGTAQDTVLGVNSGPAGYSSSTFSRVNPSIYGNSSLYDDYYPSGLQYSGTYPGYFRSGFVPHNNGTMAKQGLEILAPPGCNFLEMALSPKFSVELKRNLEQGKYIQETMKQIIPAILLLITDRNGSHIFHALLQRCEKLDLYAIVNRLSSESPTSFLKALYNGTGSRSIQRLIRRLKNTGLEPELAKALSTIAVDVMTHKIASHVIRLCFCVWGDDANTDLHACIFKFFSAVAMDPIGCITVNACIEHITGLRRSHLLHLVVKNASKLSRDPSGNFVVQNVLSIQDELLNDRICLNLSGQFVELAQKKGGSHVAEKCILYSGSGRSLVMEEISRNEKTLLMLAKHQFGNYVIQKALKVAMVHDHNMYQRLVMVIKQSCPKLVDKFEGK